MKLCWRCQAQIGLGGVVILAGAVLRLPGVLVVGAVVLAILPINRWIRHWLTETMCAALAAAPRGAPVSGADGQAL